MRKRFANIALACAAQYAAAGLGTVWGLGAAPGVRRLPGPWCLAGGIAVLMLGIEWLHYLASRRLRTATPVIPLVCLALGSYAVWLMIVEAFLWYIDDASFVTGVLLLVPFLLAMGPLIGAGAWLGASGSALYFATSLAMLTRNGFSLSGGSGFFGAWVS
jgi:hypothetical protein